MILMIIGIGTTITVNNGMMIGTIITRMTTGMMVIGTMESGMMGTITIGAVHPQIGRPIMSAGVTPWVRSPTGLAPRSGSCSERIAWDIPPRSMQGHISGYQTWTRDIPC